MIKNTVYITALSLITAIQLLATEFEGNVGSLCTIRELSQEERNEANEHELRKEVNTAVARKEMTYYKFCTLINTAVTMDSQYAVFRLLSKASIACLEMTTTADDTAVTTYDRITDTIISALSTAINCNKENVFNAIVSSIPHVSGVSKKLAEPAPTHPLLLCIEQGTSKLEMFKSLLNAHISTEFASKVESLPGLHASLVDQIIKYNARSFMNALVIYFECCKSIRTGRQVVTLPLERHLEFCWQLAADNNIELFSVLKEAYHYTTNFKASPANNHEYIQICTLLYKNGTTINQDPKHS